ncbi:hypothetical protein FH972_003493 [Carpinus fangiana]|uniref:Auxin-responsive protein n=1 Tax=Carpinus fangiana TaxID=176857 RepID=A0A5N6QIM5_9ROSI|nr:hypothetical protein FH972_003493 [Carpinus fangiana]
MGVRGSKLSELVRGGGGGGVRRRPPRGYIPICVGMDNDTSRFMVHTTTLADAEFLELLYRSAEEYGFCNEGILRIPYEAKDFEERMMTRSKTKVFRVKSSF